MKVRSKQIVFVVHGVRRIVSVSKFGKTLDSSYVTALPFVTGTPSSYDYMDSFEGRCTLDSVTMASDSLRDRREAARKKIQDRRRGQRPWRAMETSSVIGLKIMRRMPVKIVNFERQYDPVETIVPSSSFNYRNSYSSTLSFHPRIAC